MESRTEDKVTLVGPFIGLVVATLLFGFTILQTLQYYVRFPKDSLIIKSKVAFVCLLDLLHSVFTVNLVYSFLVPKGQDPLQNSWNLKVAITIQVILTTSVHFIYLRRIHTLASIPSLKRTTFPRIINVALLLIALCATGVAAVFIYGVQKTEAILSTEIAEDLRWAIFIGFGGTVVIDIVITALTCCVLHKNRQEIGLDYISKWSNRLLFRLFIYSLATGLLTSITSVLVIIIYLERPYTLDFMCLCLVVTKVDTNSLLSLAQYVRREIDNGLKGTNELRSPGSLVFRGVSQLSRWTTRDANVSVNQISPLLAGSDLELCAEPECAEDIRLPEVSSILFPYDHSFEPEIIEAESWISIRRVTRHSWINWPIGRRSSL